IRERRNFQRVYDLAERVIPDCWRQKGMSEPDAIEHLLVQALKGHGWASSGTLSQTWRLTNQKKNISAALNRLAEKGEIVACALLDDNSKNHPGWIRCNDLELAARLKRVRPRTDQGVLLSPFDPVLWDRRRVQQLFAFDQVLEIFKPAPKRKYGYYCLPVLAGDRFVGRVDLKADRTAQKLKVLSMRFEERKAMGRANADDHEALRTALDRYSEALKLKLVGIRLP
ncbi:MAG: crosslink repair DNA glycosylase YcaQ family protein, partial [Desulfobacterales bacterium]